ncbi:DUF488 domain-containing protein [Caballeronia sp. LZ029]|uniref:DUF488 domain-containing protein n=1 Tax=Caballeronia sp. LZ029 TaxID=3038564 RepID=UPI000554FDF1|nr:DUF488 domain-containing protein [Caballeronia sp. LZ029]MDR5748930.1 DUF488 domain-containing protein [Caballeronia sp. LZ029]
MMLPFCTIGHSNRTLAEFVGLLRDADICTLVDVRKIPRSRSNPQFNEDAFPNSLAAIDITYEHVAALGGLRGKTPSLPRDINGFWKNESFHNYADYALSDAFRAGLDHLLDVGRKRRCVIMCSEAVWWRCHRRIIADYLIASGKAVFHIMGQGRLDSAQLTPGAVIRRDATVTYPEAEF